jgi:hypothetical protein
MDAIVTAVFSRCYLHYFVNEFRPRVNFCDMQCLGKNFCHMQCAYGVSSRLYPLLGIWFYMR